jgi:hypothetical protein
MPVHDNWRNVQNNGPDVNSAGMSVLPRVVTSLRDVTSLDIDDDMSHEAVAARAAEQPRIAAEVAGGDLQFHMDSIDDQGNKGNKGNKGGKGGKKRTKTRAVRRKRSYKKSKKSYKKSNRCGATRKTHPEH